MRSDSNTTEQLNDPGTFFEVSSEVRQSVANGDEFTSPYTTAKRLAQAFIRTPVERGYSISEIKAGQSGYAGGGVSVSVGYQPDREHVSWGNDLISVEFAQYRYEFRLSSTVEEMRSGVQQLELGGVA